MAIAKAEAVVVIVSPDCSQATMDRSAVQAVFLGQEQRVGGAPLLVVFRNVHVVFDV
jgi:hypothetical protein